MESERLNFLRNLFNSSVSWSSISHDTVVIVKVNKLNSVLHDSSVVLSKEFFSDLLKVGHCKLPPNIYKISNKNEGFIYKKLD